MRISKSELDRYQHAFTTVDGLAQVVLRLIQEVEILKRMLRKNGAWDDAQYRKTVEEQFVSDHYSGGAAPEIAYSYFPYLLDQRSELQHRFKATDQEIAAFQKKVEDVSCLT